MRRVNQEDLKELGMRIENISCHLGADVISDKKGFVRIETMLEETNRLKRCLIMLDHGESIDIKKL